METSEPAVVLVAHGTRDPRGAETMRQLAELVAEALPGREVVLGYVDVQAPLVGDLVAEVLTRHTSALVVPVLLSRGFHVDVDIADAVAANPGAQATSPLGPDPVLADLLATRLEETTVLQGAHVVVAAAGSSRPEAAVDVERTAGWLAEQWADPVTVGYGAGASPSVPDAVAEARKAGATHVVVASYLLADGHFHDRLGEAGADAVTRPLGVDEEGLDTLAALILARLP